MAALLPVVKFLRNFGLLGLWLAASLFIYYNFRMESSAPPPERQYFGRDDQHSVLLALGVMAFEVGVLYLILRPWSYRRSVARPLLALLLFVPWTFFSMVVAVHGGSSLFFHFWWVFLLVCALAVCLAVSGVALIVRRARAHPRGAA